MLLVALLASLTLATEDLGQKKLEKMRKLSVASSSGIIDLSPAEYQELVLQNPRPYNMVVIFSVRSGCPDCDTVFSELEGAAYSYNHGKVDVPTFFAVMYYSK